VDLPEPSQPTMAMSGAKFESFFFITNLIYAFILGIMRLSGKAQDIYNLNIKLWFFNHFKSMSHINKIKLLK